MGWGIREEDTYSRQLETLLNERSQTGMHYEVINAGVPGWRPESEWAYLQAEGIKYEPDMIVLDLTVANDIYGRSAITQDKHPVFDWLRDHTYFWPFLSLQYQEAKARAQGKARILILEPPTDPTYYFPPSSEAGEWDELNFYLTEIHKIASERKIPFILVLFPLEHQVVDPTFPTLPQAILYEREKDGIHVIDLLPPFVEACNDKPGGKCKLEDRYLFADLWMHPSALGHRITAENIFMFIRDHGLLPH